MSQEESGATGPEEPTSMVGNGAPPWEPQTWRQCLFYELRCLVPVLTLSLMWRFFHLLRPRFTLRQWLLGFPDFCGAALKFSSVGVASVVAATSVGCLVQTGLRVPTQEI